MFSAVLGSILAIGTAVGVFILTKHLTTNNAQYAVVPKLIPAEQQLYYAKVNQAKQRDQNSEWDVDEPRYNTERYLSNMMALTTSAIIAKITKKEKNEKSTVKKKIESTTETLILETTTTKYLRRVCQPNQLGPVTADNSTMTLDEVERKYPEIHVGGQYFPANCVAKQRVAIIVPYRNRQRHLPIFLNHMHRFLMKQQLEYRIFVIEQNGKYDFNRAKLLNIGFLESQKLKDGGWQCFIFHDIDLLPLDERNLYECSDNPVHLSPYIVQQNVKLKGKPHFGGVGAVTWQHFTAVNGYSNRFWGWGTEDANFIERLHSKGLKIIKRDRETAIYTHLSHDEPHRKSKRKGISVAQEPPESDGLTSLKYKILEMAPYDLFTHILVEIGRRY